MLHLSLPHVYRGEAEERIHIVFNVKLKKLDDNLASPLFTVSEFVLLHLEKNQRVLFFCSSSSSPPPPPLPLLVVPLSPPPLLLPLPPSPPPLLPALQHHHVVQAALHR